MCRQSSSLHCTEELSAGNLHTGAQWVKAQEVFDSMRMRGCTPDVVTYTGESLVPALPDK